MDRLDDAGPESAQQSSGKHTESARANRSKADDTVLPMVERPVYDILNAGPRSRFVVAGNEGPVVVHNCVQCLARIILGEQALEIAKHHRIVTLTHDEVVFIAPTSKAKKALEFATDVMRTSPEWAPELPLDAEGGYAKRYGEIDK